MNQTKTNTCSTAIEQAFDFECPFECPKEWCFGNPLPFWVCGRGEYSSPIPLEAMYPELPEPKKK